jgi:hypothetical protein
MQDIVLIGIDLGKHSFHVHAQIDTAKYCGARSSAASN